MLSSGWPFAWCPRRRQSRPGSTITLAFTMRPAPGWHGYWRNPGDAGDGAASCVAASGGLAGGCAAISGARPADHRRADELCIRARLCAARHAACARRAPSRAEPSRSTPGSIIWSAPISSACPRRRPCRPSLAIGEARDPSPLFAGYRQALPRPLGSEARFEIAAGGFASPSRCPPRRRYASPISIPPPATRCAIPSRRRISRNGEWLIVETAAGPRGGEAAGDRGRAGDRARHRPGADRAAGRGAGGGDAGPDRRPAGGDGRRAGRS